MKPIPCLIAASLPSCRSHHLQLWPPPSSLTPGSLLQGHFRSDHYACEHPACIANRFVVFSTDAELKQHMALEHKDGMSKGQRREALALETAFQV